MPVFKGNVSGSVLQVAYNIPAEIISFTLINKSVGAITVNVYIRDEDGNDVSIIPYDLSLSTGTGYVSDTRVKLLSNTSIYLTTTGSCDYYFSIL